MDGTLPPPAWSVQGPCLARQRDASHGGPRFPCSQQVTTPQVGPPSAAPEDHTTSCSGRNRGGLAVRTPGGTWPSPPARHQGCRCDSFLPLAKAAVPTPEMSAGNWGSETDGNGKLSPPKATDAAPDVPTATPSSGKGSTGVDATIQGAGETAGRRGGAQSSGERE